MPDLLRSLFVPLLSLLFLALSHGLFTTFVSVRLELEGSSPALIGMTMSCFNAGLLAGASLAPRWAVKFGYSRTLILLYAANSAIVLLHALWIEAYYWMALRVIAGIAIGGFFTVMESWFLKKSQPTMRSQALSVYLIAYYVALSSGQLLLGISDPLTFNVFFIAATLSLSAAIVLGTGKRDFPPPLQEKISCTPMKRLHLGFLGGVASGIVIASLYSLGPVYGKEMGLTLEQISFLMAVIIAGGFLFQWPLGKWGDISGHNKVMSYTCFAAALIGLCIGILPEIPLSLLLILSCLFGGASFALYPLSMAYVCEGVEEARLPATAGKFIIAYSIGAILGPLTTSFFIEMLGPSGLFYFLASACAISGLLPKTTPSAR